MEIKMENVEHNQTAKKNDVVLTDICERCHREYVLNAFNIQSVDSLLCDECYRTELAKNRTELAENQTETTENRTE